MKRITVILLAIFISLSAFSQDIESGDLKKRFYIRGGISTPTWTYYGAKNMNMLKDTTTIGAESKIGANFEIGSIFMLNGIDLGPGLRFGINVDYLSLKAQVFRLQGGDNLYNFFVGSKIGPSFTYQPAKALAFDIYAKINPVWVGAIYNNLQNLSDNDLKYYLGYVQMMYSFGINVRVSVLMIGFEYDIGAMKVQNNKSGEYWPNYSDLNSKKTPMPGFNLTLGLNF